MKRQFDLYLNDILTCISRIRSYVKEDTFEEFENNNLVIDAVLNNLLIIGEASNQLQEDIKKKYDNVPWRLIIDFRNIGIHKYHSLKLELIWDVVKNELDVLEKQIKEILEKEKS